jgi:hypothetical protein
MEHFSTRTTSRYSSFSGSRRVSSCGWRWGDGGDWFHVLKETFEGCVAHGDPPIIEGCVHAHPEAVLFLWAVLLG